MGRLWQTRPAARRTDPSCGKTAWLLDLWRDLRIGQATRMSTRRLLRTMSISPLLTPGTSPLAPSLARRKVLGMRLTWASFCEELSFEFMLQRFAVISVIFVAFPFLLPGHGVSS